MAPKHNSPARNIKTITALNVIIYIQFTYGNLRRAILFCFRKRSDERFRLKDFFVL